jgi:hypothetical protein
MHHAFGLNFNGTTGAWVATDTAFACARRERPEPSDLNAPAAFELCNNIFEKSRNNGIDFTLSETGKLLGHKSDQFRTDHILHPCTGLFNKTRPPVGRATVPISCHTWLMLAPVTPVTMLNSGQTLLDASQT